MDFKPQKSVDWYDPKQLANTGIKSVISAIFGNFSDKREIQAALHHDDAKKTYSYSDGREEIWVDYISDVGDGFDATYTMASLLARESLDAGDTTTLRGNILIMGGDQVYPTASRDEYNNRLKGPYKSAYPFDMDDIEGKKAPDLYAIPGNHDWYDGLSNFVKVFCQTRAIGNWRTQQRRSYFAIQLPHNVWLFGIDVQLNSDIDYFQKMYFNQLLEEEVVTGSKIVLCTAEPSWVYSANGKTASQDNLAYLERKINEIEDSDGNKKATLVLVLAGDLHHYSRYETKEKKYKITSGGGGAFMHPTQNLPEKIDDLYGGDLSLVARFPSSSDSKKLLFRNFFFGFMNWKMALLLGGFYGIIGWLAFIKIALIDKFNFVNLLEQTLFSPIIILFLIVIIFGLGFFAEKKSSKPRFKGSLLYSVFGFAHGLGQAAMVLSAFYFLTKINASLGLFEGVGALFYTVLGCFLSGFILGGFLFGLYLILSNLILRNHDNEAYSSLKHTGFKNFIRLHVTKDELTIYPIGVKEVAIWTPDTQQDCDSFRTTSPPKHEIIERPIVIPLN